MRRKIASFRDLEVYQRAYDASIIVIEKIIPKLPSEEKFDLADQLRRSVKAIPRLIAEGYSKRHQRKDFQKYLDDALAESNEPIVSLSHAKDLYNTEMELCNKMINEYEIISRQTYRLSSVWVSFGNKTRNAI